MAWRFENVPNRVEALLSRQRRVNRGGSAAVGNQDDACPLWIDWDGQGERYKTWRIVCQESRQLDHAGLGLGGEGTALHVAKMMERQGGHPRLWAERWLREKGSSEIRGQVMRSRFSTILCIKVGLTIS